MATVAPSLAPVSWDRTIHAVEKVRDLIELCQVDASWYAQLPPALAERLKQLVENPE